MKTTKLLVSAVAFAAALAAAKANGQNLTVTLNGFNPAVAVQGTINGKDIVDYPSGLMNFSGFDGFCVEPLQSLAIDETLVYQIQTPASLANSDKIARLIGGYLQSAGTAQDAAAVQWAIWETTTEPLGSSLYGGNVRITSLDNNDVALLANQYLANFQSYNPVTLTYLTNELRQDVVTWQVVPEPTSAGLAALSALFLLRRRR